MNILLIDLEELVQIELDPDFSQLVFQLRLDGETQRPIPRPARLLPLAERLVIRSPISPHCRYEKLRVFAVRQRQNKQVGVETVQDAHLSSSHRVIWSSGHLVIGSSGHWVIWSLEFTISMRMTR